MIFWGPQGCAFLTWWGSRATAVARLLHTACTSAIWLHCDQAGRSLHEVLLPNRLQGILCCKVFQTCTLLVDMAPAAMGETDHRRPPVLLQVLIQCPNLERLEMADCTGLKEMLLWSDKLTALDATSSKVSQGIMMLSCAHACHPAARLWIFTPDQAPPTRLWWEKGICSSSPHAAQQLIGKQHTLHTSSHDAPLEGGHRACCHHHEMLNSSCSEAATRQMCRSCGVQAIMVSLKCPSAQQGTQRRLHAVAWHSMQQF